MRYVIRICNCSVGLYVSEIFPAEKELEIFDDNYDGVFKYTHKYYAYKLVDKKEYALQFDTKEEAEEEKGRLKDCFEIEEYDGVFGYDLIRTHHKYAIQSVYSE